MRARCAHEARAEGNRMRTPMGVREPRAHHQPGARPHPSPGSGGAQTTSGAVIAGTTRELPATSTRAACALREFPVGTLRNRTIETEQKPQCMTLRSVILPACDTTTPHPTPCLILTPAGTHFSPSPGAVAVWEVRATGSWGSFPASAPQKVLWPWPVLLSG